jgi:hypothetical protein
MLPNLPARCRRPPATGTVSTIRIPDSGVDSEWPDSSQTQVRLCSIGEVPLEWNLSRLRERGQLGRKKLLRNHCQGMARFGSVGVFTCSSTFKFRGIEFPTQRSWG